MDTITTEAPQRQAHPREPGLRTRKPVIALVLAGGSPHPAFGAGAPPCKPLMPFRGRPVVEYVLDAVDASCVARALVFHDPTCDLAAAGPSRGKATFVVRPPEHADIGRTIRFVLTAAVRELGIEEVRRSRLLILPCDLPFITGASLDRLLLDADARDFDLAYLVASEDLLARAIPGKRFRAFPAADLGPGRYAPQAPVLVDGAYLHAPGDGSLLAYGDWTREEADRVERTIGLLRTERSSIWLFPRIVAELGLARVRGPRSLWLTASALARVLVGRLRTRDFDRGMALLFRIRTVAIDTGSPEFSADVDRPEDLARLSGWSLPDRAAAEASGRS